MTLYNIFEGNSELFAAADAVKRTFGEIDVLHIPQVPEDGLADIKGLGAAGAPGEFFQAVRLVTREMRRMRCPTPWSLISDS
jgi:hypothetical protein